MKAKLVSKSKRITELIEREGDTFEVIGEVNKVYALYNPATEWVGWVNLKEADIELNEV